MKKIYLILFLLILMGCTKNQRTRKFGGSQEIKLEVGYKLVNATWKESSLWFLIEPMPKDYIPTTKVFYEDASFGLWNGKVTFIETRDHD